MKQQYPLYHAALLHFLMRIQEAQFFPTQKHRNSNTLRIMLHYFTFSWEYKKHNFFQQKGTDDWQLNVQKDQYHSHQSISKLCKAKIKLKKLIVKYSKGSYIYIYIYIYIWTGLYIMQWMLLVDIANPYIIPWYHA